MLFGGTLSAEWKMTAIRNQPGRDDPGRFEVIDGALVAFPGTDLGLLWHTRPAPPDYLLTLEWRLARFEDNSGVFVRFPDPRSKGYDNEAWVAIDFGFEVQINEPGVPDGAPRHLTGAIYDQAQQDFTRVPALPVGQWNRYEIEARGNVFTVRLNGRRATRFVNFDPNRGQAGPATFIGLQTHTGNVAFRNIDLRAL